MALRLKRPPLLGGNVISTYDSPYHHHIIFYRVDSHAATPAPLTFCVSLIYIQSVCVCVCVFILCFCFFLSELQFHFQSVSLLLSLNIYNGCYGAR